jgi:hypothetical protein
VDRRRTSIRRLIIVFALTACCSGSIAGPASARPPRAASGYTLVEQAALAHPGNASLTAAETTSTGEPFTWGAVNIAIPAGLKLRQLTRLSTDYKFVVGSCWGGSPRFEAWVTNGMGSWKIFFYIGPASQGWRGCPAGAYANSGNLATPTSTVDASQLSGPIYEPYADVQAKYGNYAVTAVYLDLDGGWYSDQVVDFDNTQVNRQFVNYEG